MGEETWRRGRLTGVGRVERVVIGVEGVSSSCPWAVAGAVLFLHQCWRCPCDRWATGCRCCSFSLHLLLVAALWLPCLLAFSCWCLALQNAAVLGGSAQRRSPLSFPRDSLFRGSALRSATPGCSPVCSFLEASPIDLVEAYF